MEWLDQVNGIINSPLAQQFLGVKEKDKPSPKPSPAPVVQIQNPADSGMKVSTMIMIAVGAVVAIGGLIFALKK